jgi:hypothetical protein
MLEPEVAHEFKACPEFAKLNKICVQYEEKYIKALAERNSNLYVQNEFSSSIDQILQGEIRKLYAYISEYQMNPE